MSLDQNPVEEELQQFGVGWVVFANRSREPFRAVISAKNFSTILIRCVSSRPPAAFQSVSLSGDHAMLLALSRRKAVQDLRVSEENLMNV
jgi:hypothetical protein